MSETLKMALVLSLFFLASWKLLDILRSTGRGISDGIRAIGRGILACARGLLVGLCAVGSWWRRKARITDARDRWMVRSQADVIGLQAQEIADMRAKLEELAELVPRAPVVTN